MADKDDGNDDCPGQHRDVMHLGPELGEGLRPYIRHRSDCAVETGFLKQAGTGRDEASHCDGIVRLTSTEAPDTFEVETLYERSGAGHTGPARVSSPAFREGWDRIFGGPKAVGQA